MPSFGRTNVPSYQSQTSSRCYEPSTSKSSAVAAPLIGYAFSPPCFTVGRMEPTSDRRRPAASFNAPYGIGAASFHQTTSIAFGYSTTASNGNVGTTFVVPSSASTVVKPVVSLTVSDSRIRYTTVRVLPSTTSTAVVNNRSASQEPHRVTATAAEKTKFRRGPYRVPSHVKQDAPTNRGGTSSAAAASIATSTAAAVREGSFAALAARSSRMRAASKASSNLRNKASDRSTVTHSAAPPTITTPMEQRHLMFHHHYHHFLASQPQPSLAATEKRVRPFAAHANVACCLAQCPVASNASAFEHSVNDASLIASSAQPPLLQQPPQQQVMVAAATNARVSQHNETTLATATAASWSLVPRLPVNNASTQLSLLAATADLCSSSNSSGGSRLSAADGYDRASKTIQQQAASTVVESSFPRASSTAAARSTNAVPMSANVSRTESIAHVAPSVPPSTVAASIRAYADELNARFEHRLAAVEQRLQQIARRLSEQRRIVESSTCRAPYPVSRPVGPDAPLDCSLLAVTASSEPAAPSTPRWRPPSMPESAATTVFPAVTDDCSSPPPPSLRPTNGFPSVDSSSSASSRAVPASNDERQSPMSPEQPEQYLAEDPFCCHESSPGPGVQRDDACHNDDDDHNDDDEEEADDRCFDEGANPNGGLAVRIDDTQTESRGHGRPTDLRRDQCVAVTASNRVERDTAAGSSSDHVDVLRDAFHAADHCLARFANSRSIRRYESDDGTVHDDVDPPNEDNYDPDEGECDDVEAVEELEARSCLCSDSPFANASPVSSTTPRATRDIGWTTTTTRRAADQGSVGYDSHETV